MPVYEINKDSIDSQIKITSNMIIFEWVHYRQIVQNKQFYIVTNFSNKDEKPLDYAINKYL